MQQYLYLFIDFGCILIPFVFSFHPKLKFHKEWNSFFPAMLIAAIVFLLWDEQFTRMGIWGFNSTYLTGLKISSLPIEEVLFFVCIPYACVFTYHCFTILVPKHFLQNYKQFLAQFFMTFSAAMAIIYFNKWYTVITFGSLAVFLFYIIVTNRLTLFANTLFSYLAILPFFFLSNGILTGSFIPNQVVWYNNAEMIGKRIGTIPFEDGFYGFLLILLNVVLYEQLKQRKRNQAT